MRPLFKASKYHDFISRDIIIRFSGYCVICWTSNSLRLQIYRHRIPLFYLCCKGFVLRTGCPILFYVNERRRFEKGDNMKRKSDAGRKPTPFYACQNYYTSTPQRICKLTLCPERTCHGPIVSTVTEIKKVFYETKYKGINRPFDYVQIVGGLVI